MHIIPDVYTGFSQDERKKGAFIVQGKTSMPVSSFSSYPWLTQGSSRLRGHRTTKQSIWDCSARDLSLLRGGEPGRTHLADFSVSAENILLFQLGKGLSIR